MKNLTLALCTMLLCTSAFAAISGPEQNEATYKCDLPKDAKGHAIYGGNGYAVSISDSEIRLLESSLVGQNVKNQSLAMKYEGLRNDFAIYSAGNVTATLGVMDLNGVAEESVSISVKIGYESYTASCTKE